MKSTPTFQTTQKQETLTVVRVSDQTKYIKIYSFYSNKYGNSNSINWGITAKPINADLSKHMQKRPGLLNNIIPCLIDDIKHKISNLEKSILDESTQINDIKTDIKLFNLVNTIDELNALSLSATTLRFFNISVIRSSYNRQKSSGTATWIGYGSKLQGINSPTEIEYIKTVGLNYCKNQLENLERSLKYSNTTIKSLRRLLCNKFELVRITKITDTTVSTYEVPI